MLLPRVFQLSKRRLSALRSVRAGAARSTFSSRSASSLSAKIVGPRKQVLRASVLTATSASAALLLYSLLDPVPGAIEASDVMLHNQVDDCWIVLDGEVYDVTNFLQMHPGGVGRIMEVAGGDATRKFYSVHSGSTLDKMKDQLVHVGKLKGKFTEVISEEEIRISEQRKKLPPLSRIFNLSDFESIAREILPRSTFAYYATGASDEFSIRENHYAYGRVFFRPKVLQDIAYDVDTSTEFLGAKVNLPVYISAFAGSKMAHPLAELNLQAAAEKANVMQMVPKQSSYSIEEFFEHVPDNQNHWYQYHFDDVEQLNNVGILIKELESQPTVKGLFLNVDLRDIGNREKDTRQRSVDTTTSKDLSSIVTKNMSYAKFTWKDVDKIMASTQLPIALKGIQRGEDVVSAAERGVKAVVLSNHGGRQLDFSRPPLEVLAEAKQMLKEKGLEDKIEIYLDGGVRRGSDVVKALCMGAKGVGLGRPFLYAMAGYGEPGITHLLEILEGEIKNNMRLLGVERISDLNESLVDVNSLKFRNPRANDVLYDEGYMSLRFPEFK
ncbi:LANO_0A05270g1_1 [Lachancea nothofagi CBS 11611]|uniref:LANO_0A05270g1_1 n=1 Tax=Lachancea nothofagi CBS 11611 TaxID=1266666 RepID=A0A1G4IRB0_9SACH|nr:LANO_0A05270g1_1 [Lachancea nothofagi CBS 11611]